MTSHIKLQVLICTYGKEGIERVANGKHPVIQNVEYIVSWQLPDGDKSVPDSLKKRSDFKIFKTNTRGLSRNRNIALSLATAPFCLISDDDLDYTEEGLLQIIQVFENNPTLDIATFKYTGNDSKLYPAKSFDLRKPPKGYFVSSIEIAFRRIKIVDSNVKFNENFGIGAKFPSGEENIWINDLMKKRYNGRFYPVAIAIHKTATTGTRLFNDPQFIITKGAVFAHTHPFSWPLKLIAHIYKNYRLSPHLSSFLYFKSWCKGALSYIFN